MFDSARGAFNEITMNLDADSNYAENTATNYDELAFLSNGFKIRKGASSTLNTDGGTFIYLAFAERPYKYANAR